MDDMTKQQLVLLVLLVSFVTALVTGIVTVTLVSQGPQPITQTIQRVVDRTINALPEALKKDEQKELELAALSRDVLIEDIVQRMSPAVVSVVATKDIPGQVSSGSGFFVSSDGFLITNRHVVEDTEASYSIIMNDGKKLSARVVARDSLNDLAVLKVEGKGFTAVPLGDSDAVRIGQTAIAIGNALGEFQNTVSIGVVSRLRRTIIASGAASGPEELSQVIQTDAAINPENSGGPLLNLKGEAIALNAAVAQGAENVGFAIPINQIKRAVEDARTRGKITYPYIGVRYNLITPELKEKNKLSVDYGALVSIGSAGEEAVVLNSPASKAGIKAGDIILEFGGVKITRENPLNKLIQRRGIGEKVTLKILRDDREVKLDLVLEERKNF